MNMHKVAELRGLRTRRPCHQYGFVAAFGTPCTGEKGFEAVRMKTTDSIDVDGLRLVPLQPEALRALRDGDLGKASVLTGADFREPWSGSEDVLAMRLADLERDPDYQPWSLRAIVRSLDGLAVGHIGCHAKPGADYSEFLTPAGVELGYTVFPPHRRQGFARAAVRGLMDWALSAGASHFILSIAPDNAASLSLAAGLGFVKVGSHMDEKDGPEDILELRPLAKTSCPGPRP